MSKQNISRLIFLSALVLIGSSAFLFQSCQQDFIDPQQGVAYPDEVAAIFNASLDPQTNITCASPSCHGGSNPPNGLSLVDWAKTMNGSTNGGVIIPYNAYWSFFTSVLNNDTTNTQVASVTDIALPQYHKIDQSKLQVIIDWINDGAKSKAGGVAFEYINRKTFVLNQSADVVAVVLNDPNSNFPVTRMIPVGEGGGLNSPHYININPAKTYFFVSLIARSFVEKYDVNVDYPFQRSGKVDVGSSPAHIEITPNGLKAFVSNFDVSGTVRGLTQFDPNTMSQSSVKKLEDPRMFGTHGMDIENSGNFLYAASQVGEYLFKVNITDTNLFIDIAMPVHPSVPPTGNGTGQFRPYQIRVSPEQQYLFVSCNGPSNSSGDDVVKVFKTSDLSFVKDITVGNNPILMEFTPNGQYLFVCNKNKNSSGEYTVSIIDVASQTLTATVRNVGIQPHGVDFTPGGQYAIVSCESLAGFDGHHPTVGANKIGTSRLIKVNGFELDSLRIQMGSFPSGIVTYEY